MSGVRALHAALVAVVAMWGLVFVAIARLLPQLDAVQLVVIRFTLIALVFVGIFVVVPSTRPRLRGRKEWWRFVLLGLLAVPGAQLPIVNGQNYLSPPLVSLVVTTAPAFAAIIAAIWLREYVNRVQVVGFVAAFAGVTVVIVTGTAAGGELTVSNPWGAAATLLSPVCWAAYTVLTKLLTSSYSPLTAIGTTMVIGSLLMAPLYPHAIAGLGEITITGWLWLAYLVVGGTVVPYVVWWYALSRLSAASTTAYMYAIPLAALIWSWLILGIVPAVPALIGGVVVIAGVALIQFGRRAPAPPPREAGDVPA